MSGKRRLVVGFVSVLALTAGGIQARGRGPVDPAAMASLSAETGGTARIRIHPVTGAARFVQVPPGRLPLAGRDPRERSEDFLRRFGGVFGLGDPAAELSLHRTGRDRQGFTHLDYLQEYRGVPVFGGILRLHFDADGRFTAANGTFLPGIDLDPVPARTPESAEKTAVDHVRRELGLGPGFDLAVRSTALTVYRTGLARGVGGRYYLTYQVEVGNGREVREFVFVDARTGKVVDRIPGIPDALSRKIHQPQFNNIVIWTEGNTLPYTSGDPVNDDQVNTLLDVSEDVYDFYQALSGNTFPSWDAADGILHSVWKYPGDAQIPCPNAFWSGVATYYCEGVAPDDVVAHEWTHAYTESTHNLVYLWQSGALNESYSDIFGELVDLKLHTTLQEMFQIAPRTDGECSRFGGAPPIEFTINSPANLAGDHLVGDAQFNPGPITVTGDVTLVYDGNNQGGAGTTTDGCEPLIGFPAGDIALIDRGFCSFNLKAVLAEAAGAAGVIIANNAGDDLIFMSGTTPVGIPSVFIGQSLGFAIKDELAAPTTVNVTIHQPDEGNDNSFRWLIGEDSTAFGGAIRDMWNPPCFGHPGRVSDPLRYHCGESDGGGVHTNSGIPNHAFALLADGGTYNGRSVSGIGITKAAHIYWRSMSVYQTPTTDFADHADAVEQSCADLIGAPLPDLFPGEPAGQVIAAGDCTQAAEAMLAVEMRSAPTQCNYQPLLDPTPPPLDCGLELFFDDFETDPSSTWTLSNQGVFPEYIPRDWEWRTNLPEGVGGSAFFAADDPTVGNCTTDRQSGVVWLDSPPIQLPNVDGPTLTFDHYVATEEGWDGGNVQISLNGLGFFLVDGSDFQFNSYTGLILPEENGNTNPLENLSGFTGSNEGELQGSWVRSKVDLSSDVSPGDIIRIRFAFGTDGCGGRVGWWIDNVRVCYDCGGPGGNDTDSDGVRICDGDCDDGSAASFPGATEICDGLHNNCDDSTWPQVPAGEEDNDEDGFRPCNGECDDLDPDVYPQAPEINDGQDNQCPGDAGFGIVDEITGLEILDPSPPLHLSWDPQSGATTYQVARSDSPDFSTSCSNFNTAAPLFDDPEITPPGTIRFFLVRALQVLTGSWGQDSDHVERNFVCGLEIDCANGVDDDGDGGVDCGDPDCLGDPACP